MPLAVEGGLNNPQAFAGVQLQLTPAFELSFDTVADTGVVPPGTTLDDTGDKTTEMECDCVPGCEEPPPHPEMTTAKFNAASEKSDVPLIPFLKFIALCLPKHERCGSQPHFGKQARGQAHYGARTILRSIHARTFLGHWLRF